MVNSSLTPRRVLTAVGLVVVVSFSGCSTPGTSVAEGSRGARKSAETVGNQAGIQIPAPGTVDVYQRRVEEYEVNRASRNSHAWRILYCDALLHLDEPRKAIQVLADTELAFPDSYITSMYLGLAYEMAGDLKSARHWISKTIERNGEARNSSEWLHLAMVEARQALANDPDWLAKHSVLENNTHRTAEEILGAIRIQLAVRGDFGLKQDLVVSDLYFEAGICAPSLAVRRDYFALSLEISPLRLLEIQQQEKVHAKAQAGLQVN